jgi:hypothetical protein
MEPMAEFGHAVPLREPLTAACTSECINDIEPVAVFQATLGILLEMLYEYTDWISPAAVIEQ